MAEKEKETESNISVGAEVSQAEAEEYTRRSMDGGELCSDGVMAKVLRDGKVVIMPVSEIYAFEPDERVDGIEVEDPTVLRSAGVRGWIRDRAEREFNTPERGDAVSKHSAQGSAGPINREGQEPPEVEYEEGAYEEDMENAAKDQDKAAKAAAKKATSRPTAKKSKK
jgi:hypothetical protein